MVLDGSSKLKHTVNNVDGSIIEFGINVLCSAIFDNVAILTSGSVEILANLVYE